jgi:hypothetical protein
MKKIQANKQAKISWSMKGKFLLLLLLSSCAISAQLTITPGAQFSIAGNMQLSLENTSIINNGSFTTGSSKIIFTGNAASSISGSQPILFFELEMNKANNTSIVLLHAIDVTERILFSSGFLDLNGFNIDLGSTGRLENEKETTRVTGTNGGQVIVNTVLNAPANANPGNLGAVISSSQNLGNVIIKRGHQSQAINSTLIKSILRYYDIAPANDINLDATLQVNYFDGELNGLNENSLSLLKSDNAISWVDQGISSRNTISNFIEKTGIGSFSRWTLSGISNPLPVIFTLFTTSCADNEVLIRWKTAQEQNSDHFEIEKSDDGTHWVVIGVLNAAGNSSVESSYSFAYSNPMQNNFYRVAEYDLDRNVHYTGIIKSSCNIIESLRVWPNPFHDKIFVNILAANQSQAIVKLFDAKGALVKVQKTMLLQGNNQFNLDLGSIAKSIYQLQIEWNNGQSKKTIQLIKQ